METGSLKQKEDSSISTSNSLDDSENQNNSNIQNEQTSLMNGDKLLSSDVNEQSDKSMSKVDNDSDNTLKRHSDQTDEKSSESKNIANDEDDDDDDLPPLEDREEKTQESPPGNSNSSQVMEGESKNHHPDKIKENDVEDECFHGNKMEENDTEEKKEEEAEEYLDILGNGLLKRKILKEGDGKGARLHHGDMVTINLEGRLDDGTVVDKMESFSFPLGEGDVINALDLGVTLMEAGQVMELITDAKYAYGSLGRKPDIPENSKITYTIELLKVENPPDLDKMPAGDRLQYGEKKRERGNYLFTRQDYVGAINSYTKSVKILDPETSSDSTEVLQQILDSRIKCYNNMAACQLKVDAFDAAAKSCKMVLDVQPENVKALFRMGKACAAKGETKEALQYLRKAQKLEPDTKIINQELMKLTKKLNAEKQSEINMYQKMLGTSQKSSPAKSNSQSKNSSWIWTSVAGAVIVSLVAVSIAAYRHLQH